MRLLLDSVIVIDHFNGVSNATAYLAAVRTEAAVSVITRAEVLAGLDDLAAVKAQRLLDCFPTLPIDREAADLAASLRRSHHWRLPDAFQAALALRHGLLLVTRNTKDFPPSKHRFVLVPYRL
ncbi:MAG: PIN domain-containing protein [Acidobacteriota bacterium]